MSNPTQDRPRASGRPPGEAGGNAPPPTLTTLSPPLTMGAETQGEETEKPVGGTVCVPRQVIADQHQTPWAVGSGD